MGGGRRWGLPRARTCRVGVVGRVAAPRPPPAAAAIIRGVSRSGTRVRTKRARPHLSPAGARHLADVWARTPPADVVSRLSPSRGVCVSTVDVVAVRHRRGTAPIEIQALSMIADGHTKSCLVCATLEITQTLIVNY